MNPSWLYSTVKCDVIKNLVKTPGPLRSTKNFRPGRGSYFAVFSRDTSE